MVEPFFPIPENAINLKDTDFFDFITYLCGKDVTDYFELLGVRSVHSLLGIDDVFLPLQQDYIELDDIKKRLTFCRSDGTCVIKIGIQHDVVKLLKSLRNALIHKQQMTTSQTNKNDLILSQDLLQKYPVLKYIIEYFVTLENSQSTDKPFHYYFLENFLSNLPLAKSRYRYNGCVMDFALCLSILAGRNAYQFLYLNLPGSLPNLTTIKSKLANEGFRTHEGAFRYNEIKKYMSITGAKYAICSEDCTAVLRKIVYDVKSNLFVGFTPSIDENGLPVMEYFRTNSFEQLKTWFEQEDISHFINQHMIQPLSPVDQPNRPYPLASYGTNGKYTYVDIIRRWYTIFEKSLTEGVHILGYSTDADPRYLLAMKLISGFFSTLLNDPKINHPLLFTIDIPNSWSWFYMPRKQLFMFMQDSIHIATKLRNRLLSNSSIMLMGDAVVTIDHLFELIESQSKFNHNLVKSDIRPQDKQNFRSCEKLCGALECLKDVKDSHGTYVFLTIIRCIIKSFIDTSTATTDRIYFAWLAVFICRIWRTWLDLVPKQDLNSRISEMNNITNSAKEKFKKKKTKQIFFITSPTYLCIELNAHFLTYLTLLVADDQLPPEALKVYLFNSQPCENFFRLGRAMSGTFSVNTSFSVQQYFHRQEKISMSYSIKNQTNSSASDRTFQFPQHHKTQQNSQYSSVQLKKITKEHVEEQVNRAFEDAIDLLQSLNMNKILKKSNIVTMKKINEHVRNHFKRSARLVDIKISVPIDEGGIEFDSDSDVEESDNEETEQYVSNNIDIYSDNDDIPCEYDTTDDNNIYSLQHTTDDRLHTTKGICDTINPTMKDSYFLVNINGKKKYMHKSTAVWYLTDDKHKLSSDRTYRVMDT